MTDEEFDEMMDNLGPATRAKVLTAMGAPPSNKEPQGQSESRYSKDEDKMTIAEFLNLPKPRLVKWSELGPVEAVVGVVTLLCLWAFLIKGAF